MNNMGGLILGMIAGAIGAAVWAAIAHFGNVESGWVAWGIGAFVGFAVSAGSRERGMMPAMIAVIITVAALCAGKYAALALMVQNMDVVVEITPDDAMGSLAYAFASEKETAGDTLDWKHGMSLDSVDSFSDFPKDIQTQAREYWIDLSQEEKDDIIAELEDEFGPGNIDMLAAFTASFTAFDLLFFGLGIFTAAKLAYADVINEDGDSEQQELAETEQ